MGTFDTKVTKSNTVKEALRHKDQNKQITNWVTPDPYNSFSPDIRSLSYMISRLINLTSGVSP